MIYQQGDVLIESCEVPTGAKDTGDLILARGEVTGHAHRIEVAGDMKGKVVIRGLGGQLYVQNTVEVPVVHEEHGKVVLPPGEWRVRRVREYDHFQEEAREVRD